MFAVKSGPPGLVLLAGINDNGKWGAKEKTEEKLGEIAVLFLAHRGVTQPDLWERWRGLGREQRRVRFVVHANPEVDQEQWFSFRYGIFPVCQRVVPTAWCQMSLVLAYQAGLRYLLSTYPKVGVIYFVSGDTVPIRPVDALLRWSESLTQSQFEGLEPDEKLSAHSPIPIYGHSQWHTLVRRDAERLSKVDFSVFSSVDRLSVEQRRCPDEYAVLSALFSEKKSTEIGEETTVVAVRSDPNAPSPITWSDWKSSKRVFLGDYTEKRHTPITPRRTLQELIQLFPEEFFFRKIAPALPVAPLISILSLDRPCTLPSGTALECIPPALGAELSRVAGFSTLKQLQENLTNDRWRQPETWQFFERWVRKYGRGAEPVFDAWIEYERKQDRVLELRAAFKPYLLVLPLEAGYRFETQWLGANLIDDVVENWLVKDVAYVGTLQAQDASVRGLQRQVEKARAAGVQRMALIANTSADPLRGSHWVAVLVSGGGRLEYFDSFGHGPPGHLAKVLKQLFPHESKNLVFSSTTHQQDCEQCGMYALWFLDQRLNFGTTFEQISRGPPVSTESMIALRHQWFLQPSPAILELFRSVQ